ncbi:MAG: sensor histidine kinase [Paenibacillaceae bacterium]|nr:MAG: sensor histidine kinase [Paenibacillaceae bacterium]
MNLFKSQRIDRLLFGTVATISIAVLAVVVYVGYSLSAKKLAENATRYQQTVLNQINRQLMQQIDYIEQLSLTAVRHIESSENVQVRVSEYERFTFFQSLGTYLAQLTYSSPAIDSIEYYLVEGKAYPIDNPFAVRFFDAEAITRAPWSDELQSADAAWIAPHRIGTPRGDVEVVSFARKAVSKSGNPLGWLLIHVKPAHLESIMLGGESNGEGSGRVLLDGRGNQMVGVGNRLSADHIVLILQHMDGTGGGKRIRLSSDGKRDDQFVVWVQMLNTGWVLLEVTPWSEIVAGSVQVARLLTLISVAGSALLLLFTLVFSKFYTRPISLLLNAMGSFSIGMRQYDLPNDYRNEFGVLFAGFRKLTDRITELYGSLKEEYRRKKEAEISALQANINPHFLYNTLNQLNWMAIDAGQEKISHALELLGRMLRLGLSNGERFIPLKDEMEYLQCYLDIQRIRLGDGLDYNLDAGPDAEPLYVPKLTLQPFVENSIIHGFHDRDSGLIRVEARREGERLVIRIVDDGVGVTPDWRRMRGSKKGGYGIRNVEERLYVYFGQRASVTVQPLEAGGTEVIIAMPALAEIPENL